MATILLPTKDRKLAPYTTGEPIVFPSKSETTRFNRIAYAAVHVVADPLADIDPWVDAKVDWDKTIAFRHYLWDLGLGVAEAMDTAQRGGGLDWPAARELIRHALEAAKTRPGVKICCGVGTDQLAPGPDVAIDDIIRAYEEQIEAVEAMGGKLVVMASRALAAAAKTPEDYAHVYGRILRQVREPVIIHWLGEMFDPALAGYWGAVDHAAAMETCLSIMNDNAAKIDGVKISLLSKDKEIAMRRKLPARNQAKWNPVSRPDCAPNLNEGARSDAKPVPTFADRAPRMRMYTGDDFNYAELIAGDEDGYSDALLGIFDAIAPAASAGLARLAAGDIQGFHGVLEPTVPLSRHIFQAPTRFYKTGVVFLAWLNGLQDHFIMVGGQESARSLLHLAELFRLADKARVLHDPDLAASRMTKLLATHGLA
ncbi:MAG: dihydrodipicolinate synthase family protein [Betaproteobacteria bacterium]|nr:dihydrodipicolinate synthase family protein [Betaproteobacteria bacterium]